MARSGGSNEMQSGELMHEDFSDMVVETAIKSIKEVAEPAVRLYLDRTLCRALRLKLYSELQRYVSWDGFNENTVEGYRGTFTKSLGGGPKQLQCVWWVCMAGQNPLRCACC